MEDFFKDWGEIILALVALIFGVWAFVKQFNRKKLTYRIATNEEIIRVDNNYKNEIGVSYKNRKVDNIKLLLMEIKNLGNSAITKEDFETNISIVFPDDTQILACTVIKKTPENLSVKNELKVRSNISSINPLLLNPNDAFTVRFLLEDMTDEPTIQGRIKGIQNVKRVTNEYVAFTKNTRYFVYSISSFFLSWIVASLIEEFISNHSHLFMITIFLFFISFAITLIFLFSMIDYVIKFSFNKIRDFNKP